MAAVGGGKGGSANLIIMVFFWNKIFSDLASSLALNFIMCKFLFFIILFYFILFLIHWFIEWMIFLLSFHFFFFFCIIILLYYVIISFSALIALLTEELGDYLCLARNYLYANTVLIKHCVKRVQIRSFFWSVFPAFRLNTEIYGVGLRIQSKCGKTQTRKNSLFGHFSRSEKEYSSVLLAPSFSPINCKSLMVIKVIERIMKFAIIKPFKITSWPKNFTSIETKTKV